MPWQVWVCQKVCNVSENLKGKFMSYELCNKADEECSFDNNMRILLIKSIVEITQDVDFYLPEYVKFFLRTLIKLGKVRLIQDFFIFLISKKKGFLNRLNQSSEFIGLALESKKQDIVKIFSNLGFSVPEQENGSIEIPPYITLTCLYCKAIQEARNKEMVVAIVEELIKLKQELKKDVICSILLRLSYLSCDL